MDRVPLTPKQPKETLVVSNNAVQVSTPFKDSLNYLDSIEYHRTADFFNLSMDDRQDSRVAQHIDYLMEWAREATGSNDRVDDLLKIKSLIKGLGYQMVGKDLIDRLYRWTRLDADRKRIEKKMEVVNYA